MQILISSFDILLKKILYDYLTDQGHVVKIFDSLLELYCNLSQIRSHTDLILIDFMENETNQMRYINKMHHLLPGIPIVAITYISGILPVAEALSHGIYAYLRKPVSLSEIDLLISKTKIIGKNNTC